eukprot:jgi/Mesvir1/13256/Mv12235-RA.1
MHPRELVHDIKNEGRRIINRATRQMDALTKEFTVPLTKYVTGFPELQRLHPFERALVELSLGQGVYEEVIRRVDGLRKKLLETGKNTTAFVAKSKNKKEAVERKEQGFAQLSTIFEKGAFVVEELKKVGKILRSLPVVNNRAPTLCLVGAPNVGKSSLVRVLSSGRPEVCDYPFTTKSISMGHIYVNNQKTQVTDTPGLLYRPDADRNDMEKLTLAALTHLPSAVVFVHDRSGLCGTSIDQQYLIYRELRQRFGHRSWIDVLSKCDLPAEPIPAALLPAAAATRDGDSADEDETPAMDEAARQEALERAVTARQGPPGAIPVSLVQETGLDTLKARVLEMLSNSNLYQSTGEAGAESWDDGLPAEEDEDAEEDGFPSLEWNVERQGDRSGFYYPAFRPGPGSSSVSS